MNEKSLLTGTPADEQFSEFVEPAAARISVVISSDTRQAGTLRLARAIAKALREEGYTDVRARDWTGAHVQDEEFITPDVKIVELQKQVPINIQVK